MSATVVAEEDAPSRPLRETIDHWVARRAGAPAAPRSTDAEFLRRIYLDLAGRIPSPAETRAFLADTSAAKREAVVDRLLGSDAYVLRMTNVLHVMLMERLGEHEDWRRFLEQSIRDNKPWDQLVQDILHPDAEDDVKRGAAYFYTKRLEKYGQNPIDMPGLVRDVGRLFLGVDLQCAQCHDHLFVDDYKQQDYQGLFAFVGHTFIRRDTSFPAVGENLLLEKVAFKSVFVMEERKTGPRLPGGEEFEIPKLEKDEAYLVPPDRKKRTPGVPAFSPLKLLSQQLPHRDNRAFRRNIANRLWWLLMGRGLVEPLDQHHSANPATHPELLDALADALGARQFDLQWLLREIALSESYQRSGRWDGEAPDETAYRTAVERPLSAEQLLFSMLQATGGPDPRPLIDPSAKDAPQELVEWRDQFVAAFARPPREAEVDHNPTVKAALFLLNGETVLGWLQPRDNNLMARLTALPDPAEVADELYVSVLSRGATPDETKQVADYLSETASRREDGLRNLAWSLLASTEFCVNH